ncbi:MAG: L-lactate dehydrogenase complex protein LldF [Solirubrobacteraceae bacterium]|jgi:L-lactate utilization protein LutC|nr:L-lactate dehydrogenase complex protein LldF [Solirubrobacteraceae bacterium]
MSAGEGGEVAADDGELIGQFRDRLEELDGTLHEAPSLPAAHAIARELIGAATVARWSDEVLEGIVGPEQEAPAVDADVSLIIADVAVAGTGAVGFVHRGGRARSTGLLPPRQVVLLDVADLVADLATGFAHVGLRASPQPPPSNVVFAAGPSRTSDIEQRSIRGVHAPRDLTVVIFRR